MICAKCAREMTVIKNGVPVKDPDMGCFESTVWWGDKYGCEDCGAEIISGMSKEGVLASRHPESAKVALSFKYPGA